MKITEAANGIATNAPSTPSKAPPDKAAITTIGAGTDTATFIMRGLIKYASSCR
jgi:hypothetical protein